MGFVDFLFGTIVSFLFEIIVDFLRQSIKVLVAITICAGFGSMMFLMSGKAIVGAILGTIAVVSGIYVIYKRKHQGKQV